MRRRSRVVSELIAVMLRLAARDPRKFRAIAARIHVAVQGVDKKSTK